MSNFNFSFSLFVSAQFQLLFDPVMSQGNANEANGCAVGNNHIPRTKSLDDIYAELRYLIESKRHTASYHVMRHILRRINSGSPGGNAVANATLAADCDDRRPTPLSFFVDDYMNSGNASSIVNIQQDGVEAPPPDYLDHYVKIARSASAAWNALTRDQKRTYEALSRHAALIHSQRAILTRITGRNRPRSHDRRRFIRRPPADCLGYQ